MRFTMEYGGRTIVTSFECPPIPVRYFDWSAVFEDYDGAPDSHCPIGRGVTEKQAIDDLIEQAKERV